MVWEPLVNEATPELYEGNVFRVLNAPVDIPYRAALSRVEEIRLQTLYGGKMERKKRGIWSCSKGSRTGWAIPRDVLSTRCFGIGPYRGVRTANHALRNRRIGPNEFRSGRNLRPTTTLPNIIWPFGPIRKPFKKHSPPKIPRPRQILREKGCGGPFGTTGKNSGKRGVLETTPSKGPSSWAFSARPSGVAGNGKFGSSPDGGSARSPKSRRPPRSLFSSPPSLAEVF